MRMTVSVSTPRLQAMIQNCGFDKNHDAPVTTTTALDVILWELDPPDGSLPDTRNTKLDRI
jgi:hypothetical protein